VSVDVPPGHDGEAVARDFDDVSDEEEQVRLGARLREAREYVGLLQEDVANALAIPRASVSALEAGKRKVTSLELRRLSRLYRRSVAWLLGEAQELSEAEPLFRAAAALSTEDREQVLRFAEFLAAAGTPASPRRRAGGRTRLPGGDPPGDRKS
jgi:transcriptional regulator with XRE-family HTH domain